MEWWSRATPAAVQLPASAARSPARCPASRSSAVQVGHLGQLRVGRCGGLGLGGEREALVSEHVV